MATYKNIGTSNFTTAANWAVVKAYNETETAIQALTTTPVAAPNYTATTETADGVLVKFSTRANVAGTITCQLYNVTTATVVATQTIDVTDLGITDFTVNYIGCWYYFKFASTVALTSGQNYAVRLSATTGAVWAWRSTANNWNVGIVTTTTGTPTTADVLIVTGEQTGSGTYNSFTVTMDNTATTSWGNIYVGSRGTLDWGTTASTAYYLKLVGNFYWGKNSVVNIGTAGTPMPSTSTASIEFVCASASQYGIVSYGTITTYGATKNVSTKLAANAAIAATTLTTSTSTSWKSGDVIAIAGTTQTSTQAEKRTLSVDAAGTTLTITAGLTNAHGGVAPVQADIINLTRNVKIFGNSTTNVTYIYFPAGGADVSFNYTEIYFCGTNVSTRSTFEIQSAANFTVNYCSMYDSSATTNGLTINRTTIGTISITYHVGYNMSSAINIPAAITQTTWTIDNCIIIRGSMPINDVGGTLTNCIVANAGTANGCTIYELSATAGTINGLTAYGNAGRGFLIYTGGTISNLTVWRNTDYGILINSLSAIAQIGQMLMIDTFTAFGNGLCAVAPTGVNCPVIVKNGTITGGTTLVQPYGFFLGLGSNESVYFVNCTSSGNSTADIGLGSTNFTNFVNCTFSSGVESINSANLTINYEGYSVSSVNHQGITGNNKDWQRNGTIQTDTTIYNLGSPSIRLTPTNATFKLYHKPIKIAVTAGQACTVSVYVRKSVVGDGTAYNGNQPRLILRQNPLAGFTTDTVLDTATNAANGAWLQLSGTTSTVAYDCVLEFYVDCDGTLGWVNIDDWNTTTNVNTKGTGYWDFGQPFINSYFSGQKSYTFVG